jgi:hypothetical protein
MQDMEARRNNPWLVLVIVGLAQFMVILDATIVNVALPPSSEACISRRQASSGR